MARIRSIKPELRTDLEVASWPIAARYTWVLLLGYLDDSGRGLDNLRLLKADLFPLDDQITPETLNAWLDLMCQETEMDRDPPLCRYQVHGASYLHATRWKKHQRISHPTPSRWPPCPKHESSGMTPE